MAWRIMLFTGVVIAAAAISVVVYAQLTDTRSASGSLSAATSASVDLYICEPDSTVGPACGSDDSGADETIFETLEDLTPGDLVSWDIRLQNVGADEWTILLADGQIAETVDPGSDCDTLPRFEGLTVLGKDGDGLNDNRLSGEFIPGAPNFTNVGTGNIQIRVAAGDYEDLRINVLFPAPATGCDGNEWSIDLDLTVG